MTCAGRVQDEPSDERNSIKVGERMLQIRHWLAVSLAVIAAPCIAAADNYVFRAKPGVVGVESSPSGPKSPGVKINQMGLKDSGLASALSNALGPAGWEQCTEVGNGGTTSCVGAAETLVVFTNTSTGVDFGLYAKIDIWNKPYGYAAYPGFYFTNTPNVNRKGYLLDRNGEASATGLVEIGDRSSAVPLIQMHDSRPIGYTSNHYVRPGWQTGYTLTGDGHLAGVQTTVKWYRR